MSTRWFALLTLLSSVVLPYASSQTAAPTLAASALTAVPPLIPYSGQVEGRTGETSATFLIYKDQIGGEPLFTETQTVVVDTTGRYGVQLGAANPNGLPSDLFSSGEARWLEVQIAGQAAEARVLMASVPYALKAADAATLGGLPASAFALAGSNTGMARAGIVNATSGAVSPDAAATVTTTGGTTNKIAKFSGANTIVNSIIYDNGTEVGIGTTTPTATLTVDGTLTVNGNSTYDGQLVLPATGTATASAGFASQFVKLQTSAYNSSSKSVLPPRFQLQAEVTGNNTASPNATLNLLASATSTPPVETGFYLNTNGTIHFASSQTFPAISSSGTVSGDSGSGIGVVGTSGSGTGVQGNSTSSYGVEGSSNTAPGVLGYTVGGTLNTGGVVGQAGATSGFGGIAGVWGDASAHVGVLGTSSQYSGVQGLSSSGPGVQGQSTSGVGVQGSSTNSAAGQFTTGSPSATIYATNTASNGGQAFNGVAQGSYGIAVYASETGTDGTGVEAFGNGNGVIGDTSGGVLQTAGVLGVAGTRTGVGGIAGVWGDAQEHVGVIGSSKDYAGVYGTSTNSYGVQALSTGSAGVYGVGGSSATTFSGTWAAEVVGVWGDTTGVNGDEQTAIGGTASDGEAAQFSNNSNMPTVLIVNYGGGDTIADDLKPFRALEATTPSGTCGFGDKGNMTCTGQLKSLATTSNGTRTVETYSMQSPENWMEDFGSGALKNGVTTVSLDAAFAETVSGNADYHVFLTPRGDSKGLYVTNATAASFEVHESGGGTSTIGFDYRIVAKRRGFEAQRMVDVTEAMSAVKDKNEILAARLQKKAGTK